MSETSEKGGTTSCATSCAPCGDAEMLFPSREEQQIDQLKATVAQLEAENAKLRGALTEMRLHVRRLYSAIRRALGAKSDASLPLGAAPRGTR